VGEGAGVPVVRCASREVFGDFGAGAERRFGVTRYVCWLVATLREVGR
jgi:hypothetical protein